MNGMINKIYCGRKYKENAIPKTGKSLVFFVNGKKNAITNSENVLNNQAASIITIVRSSLKGILPVKDLTSL